MTFTYRVLTGRKNRRGFRDHIDYIRRPGAMVELLHGNLHSDRCPEEQMAEIAAQGRARDPVYAFVLSFPDRAAPRHVIPRMLRETMRHLGCADHQYVAAVHTDTAHLHVHIVLNRVHPVTHHAWLPRKNAFRSLRAAGRRLAGLSESDQRERRPTQLSSGARNFETWTMQESFQRFCRERVLPRVAALMETPHPSWNDLHALLAGEFGVVYQHESNGARIRDAFGKSAIAADGVHPCLRLADLQLRLGPHTPPSSGIEPLSTNAYSSLLRQGGLPLDAVRDPGLYRFFQRHVAERRDWLEHGKSTAAGERFLVRRAAKDARDSARAELRDARAVAIGHASIRLVIAELYRRRLRRIREDAKTRNDAIAPAAPHPLFRAWLKDLGKHDLAARLALLSLAVVRDRRMNEREPDAKQEQSRARIASRGVVARDVRSRGRGR